MSTCVLATNEQRVSCTSVSAKGAAIHASLGQRPRNPNTQDNQALKARLKLAWLLNPKRTAHRNQHRACEATRGIPPERCGCDGALVVPRRIASGYRADSGSPKRRHIHAARKNRDTSVKRFDPFRGCLLYLFNELRLETVRGSVVTM